MISRKQNFVPLNNNLDKALAFAPSLREDFHKDFKVKRPQNMVDSLEAVKKLQAEGWVLDGITEDKNELLKPVGHQIKLSHPDIRLGKEDGMANTYITNKVVNTGYQDFMMLSLGVYRQVCGNGLWAMRDDVKEKILNPHDLDHALNSIETESNQMIKQFERIREIELSQSGQFGYAQKALQIRFGQIPNIDYKQLLNVNRDADKGDNVWKVYNRIQENLTKPAMLKNKQGFNVTGVTDYAQNQRVNQELYKLMVSPYIN